MKSIWGTVVVSKMEITTSTSEDSSVVQQEGSRWINKSDSVSEESSATVNLWKYFLTSIKR